MKQNIKTKELTLTLDVRNYLEIKIARLEKFLQFPKAEALLEIELARTTQHHQSGDIYRAEINILVPGENFRTDAQSRDIYAAIDIAVDEMEEQLSRSKGKRETLFRKGGRTVKNLLRRFYPMNNNED